MDLPTLRGNETTGTPVEHETYYGIPEMKLLVTDDNDVNRALLRAQLESEGHDVIEAANGREALQNLQQENVDGIISDILMPEMDGFRFCLEVRRHENLRALPFILYTSTYDSPEDRDLANEVGADAYIIKPSPLHTILDAISNAKVKPAQFNHGLSPLEEDAQVFKQYNEALVRKLEERNEELTGLNAALKESENRFTNLLEKIELISIMLDREANITYCNEYLSRITGWNKEEVLGLNWFELFISDDEKGLREMFESLIADKPDTWHHTNSIITRYGKKRLIRWNNTVLRATDGEVIGTASIGEDITEKMEAEKSLQESEERFRQLAENIREVFWLTDPDKKSMLYVSPAYESIWGRSVSDLYANPQNWPDAIHEEDRAHIINVLPEQAAGTYDEMYRIVRPDGSIRRIHDQAFPVKNHDGKVYRIAGVAEDITERLTMEEQLQQAQKMEAIGQLTGGIAHDFNNRLTVILGSLQILQSRVRDDPDNTSLLKSSISAVNGASELTSKLLTFSRQNVLRTSVFNVNELVNDMQDMLQRTLGETIEVNFIAGEGAWTINSDRNMLENVLLNLAVNARDAMPDGGRLTIETRNYEINEATFNNIPLQAGDYLLITINDTGTGISSENIQRVFEPFFTTKEKGKGTGLGLSMVYGFVKHSGGHIEINSVEGRGTRFSIYLPRNTSGQQETNIGVAPGKIDTSIIRGKTVLLVEDDEAVRQTAVAMLEFMGIRLITAGNGPEALEVFAKHPDIDLLFTDMVMPGGMNGQELAEKLREQKPDLKVLYTSGYAPQAANDQRLIQQNDFWLAKPYQLDDLRHEIFNALTQ